MTSHDMTKALIIGGGIAGPVTAVALQRAGIEPVVYEAYDRAADGVGAFLTVAPNGLDALATLGLDAEVRRRGFDTPRMELYSGTGKQLGVVSSGTGGDAAVSQTITRPDLYVVLRDAAASRGVPIEYGKRLVDVRTTATGVTARFADGSEATGDLLVGADGLQSRTRQIIDAAAPAARYVGLGNAGGYARGVPLAAGETPGVMRMVFGKRCFFCWMRHPDGDVWWFANPPAPVEPTRAEIAAVTPDEWRRRLVAMFADDASPAVDIVDATTELFAGWNTYDFPTVPTWHRDRMVIVGDAAHATSPASGQGASMAMEDAVVLAKCLRDVGDVDRAFAEYERLRRARVERIVATGKRNSNTKIPGRIGRTVRDLVLPFFLRQLARNPRATSWMYDYRVDWDEPVAARSA